MARQTFYFSDGPYLQSMQGLHAALSGSEAFVKFIGQPRTGKSGVCEKLAQFMRLKDYQVLYFDYPVESPDMLRSMLAKQLDIPDSYNMLRHLEDTLATDSEKPLVLIFDDAHLLSDITLIEIYRFAGVQVDQKRIINIVLCGEPELERRLSSKKEFTPLLHHVSHNFLLEPMDAATTSRFLLAYLEKMELPNLQLEPAALTQFYKSSKGYPGPVYSLCQLVPAIRQNSEELHPISKDELLLAIRSMDSEQPVPSSLLRDGNRRLLFAPLAAVVVIASLAFLVRQLSPADLQNDVAETTLIDMEISTEPAARANGDSPFADDELRAQAQENDASVQTDAASSSELIVDSVAESRVDEPTQEQPPLEDPLPVSDSNLALVTAQERGISNEVITEPLFEQMLADAVASSERSEPTLSVVDESDSSGDTVALTNVTLTRPMLALDDEEVVVESEPEVVLELGEAALQETNTVAASEVSSQETQAEAKTQEPAAATPQQMVQAWLDAWEGQDLESYFASYDEAFVPRYHRNRAAWQSNRERVIGNASQITLELSDFVLVIEDAETIEVHFWLAYTSPSYRDDTRKKLILKKRLADEEGATRLVILEEINLEVRV